jgi:Putative prokaryotic signal transducing protein
MSGLGMFGHGCFGRMFILMSDEPSESIESDEHAEPVVVAVHGDRGEAEVTVAHLAANGIEGFVVDEVEGGMVPVDGEVGVVVAVRAADAELARRVLDADPA